MIFDEITINDMPGFFGQKIILGESLARHTSMGVGGPAEVFFEPESIEEISGAIKWCISRNIPWYILGGGTNIIVKDHGIEGLVIAITKKLSGFIQENISESAVRLTVKSGTGLSSICSWAEDNGMTGLEFAAGIPGTFGGAVKMNAGTSSGWMSDIIESIKTVMPDGSTRIFLKDEIQSSYRNLQFESMGRAGEKNGFVIAEAAVLLRHGVPHEIRKRVRMSLEARKATQPLGFKNSGCIFRNPDDSSPAGKLIEMTGLKGFRIGGAEVSEKHANFIVNTGLASASDIMELIETVRSKVMDKFSVSLEPEVIIAG